MSDLNPTIKKFENIDDEVKKDFENVIAQSEGYEPYFDTGCPVYIAYVDDEPVGVLTYAILKENQDIPDKVDYILPGSGASFDDTDVDDNSFEAEFTIFVKKEYRKKKIATQLIEKAKKDLEEKYDNLKIIVSLPEALLRSSLASAPVYAELFLRLGREKFLQVINSPKVQGITKDVEMQTKLNRSDDGKTYTLSQGNKEIASVNLDFEPNAINLFKVFVEPVFRNRGFGTTLVAKVLNEVFSDKDAPVVLNVKSTNKAAVNLYENVGFDEVERIWYFKI